MTPSTLKTIEAQLMAPGTPFALTREEVLGETMEVFAQRARSLRELLVASSQFGDVEYLVFSERRLTFAQHARAAASVAQALHERYGVGPGDRVAILAANCPEWIIAFWATVSLGAIAVGFNGWWVGDEIRYALQDCTPKLLIADPKRLARLPSSPTLPIITIPSQFQELIDYAPEAPWSTVPIAEDDPAALLYTSGTTGRPKGALSSHRNIIAMTGAQIFHGARAALLAQAHTPPDRHDEASNQGPSPLPPCGLVTTPLFHVSGLYAGAVTRLLVGSKTVWTTGRFNAETVMRLIEREKVTGWGPTGTMLYRVLHHPKRTQYDLSSLNFVGLGGSAIDPALVALARTTLPGATVAIGYGLTEGTAFSTLNWGDLLDQAPNSVGRPMPTVEVQIRDPATGLPVAAGEEGEVCLRGPMVMLGYWQRPELNRARLLEGRWLRTGDMGFVRDGIVTLCSRRRDLIIRGGENVHPAEIEHRIQAHPEVAEAAVVGVDSPEWGQEVKAIVVAKAPEQPPSQEALKAWVSARLASYKVPTHWAFVHEPLPRNASGKVMKHLLVDGTAEQVLAEPE